MSMILMLLVQPVYTFEIGPICYLIDDTHECLPLRTMWPYGVIHDPQYILDAWTVELSESQQGGRVLMIVAEMDTTFVLHC